MKKGLYLMISIFLLSACNEKSEPTQIEELREELIEVTQFTEELALEKEHVDEAIKEANALSLQGDDRDWFVRSYLIDISTGKEIKSTEQVYEDSQLRMLYEQTWQDLAYKKYGVSFDEERLQEITEMALQSVTEEKFSSEKEPDFEILFYLADALGYSIEEFFYIFERHHYERWAIGEKLYPILEEHYDLTDNLEISYQYKMEVIDELVKNQS